jgi:hypothetical protein
MELEDAQLGREPKRVSDSTWGLCGVFVSNASAPSAQDKKQASYVGETAANAGGEMPFTRPVFDFEAIGPDFTPTELVLLENCAVALRIGAAHPKLLRQLVQAFPIAAMLDAAYSLDRDMNVGVKAND